MPVTFIKKNKVFELPRPSAPLFDTHAHLHPSKGADAVALLERAHEAGVRSLVAIFDPVSDRGAGIGDAEGFSRWLADTARDASGRGRAVAVRYLVGVHPYGAASVDEAVCAQIERALRDPLCAGIGEIGLDYHFDMDDSVEALPHGVQMEAMERQLELAIDHGVPVELHIRSDAGDASRAAHVDAAGVLERVGTPPAGCVLHCFGEDRATMERFVGLGCHIAFGGAATFKRNERVREAFAACPIDRLLFETDCPYMAPEPIRGLECEPAMIAQTADVLIRDRSDRTGESPASIAGAVWENSVRLFG